MAGGDMDDASSALIAKILMQDQLGADYDPELWGEIGEVDADYAPAGAGGSRRKRSTTSTPAKRGRKAPEASKSTATPASQDEEIDLEKTRGGTGEKDAGNGGERGTRSGAGYYTEEEEKKFLEGLELFGRDWPKLSKHIGTRDRHSVRSHAQKYFLRMYRSGTPLPAKVLESGAGYTLSGKPLDPESAAARPYMQASVPRTREPPPQGDEQPAAAPKKRKEKACGIFA